MLKASCARYYFTVTTIMSYRTLKRRLGGVVGRAFECGRSVVRFPSGQDKD